MRLRVAIVVLVLVVALGLYGLATAIGAGQPDGTGGGVQQGPVPLLGKVLVRPASASDVVGTAPCAIEGRRVMIPAGGTCRYRLQSQFLALRLRLGVTGPGPVTAELTQPDPRSVDTATIEPGRHADLTYRESGSSLALSCRSPARTTCEIDVG